METLALPAAPHRFGLLLERAIDAEGRVSASRRLTGGRWPDPETPWWKPGEGLVLTSWLPEEAPVDADPVARAYAADCGHDRPLMFFDALSSRLMAAVMRLDAPTPVIKVASRMEARFAAYGEAGVTLHSFDFDLRVNDVVCSAFTGTNSGSDAFVLHRFDTNSAPFAGTFGAQAGEFRAQLTDLVFDYERIILDLARTFGAPIAPEIRSTIA